jgi:hypothetical protein
VGTLERDRWTRFELRFSLGERSEGNYTLVIKAASGETKHLLPFGAPSFDQIAWLGITAPDDADGVFYLDDLKLEVDDD